MYLPECRKGSRRGRWGELGDAGAGGGEEGEEAGMRPSYAVKETTVGIQTAMLAAAW